MIEVDPNGKDPHEPGAKLDAGKDRVGLMIEGFCKALRAVSRVSTYGARKYTDGGWESVPEASSRYTDAMGRHLLDHLGGEELDPESELLHLSHMAWNALAVLELHLRETTPVCQEPSHSTQRQLDLPFEKAYDHSMSQPVPPSVECVVGDSLSIQNLADLRLKSLKENKLPLTFKTSESSSTTVDST